MADSKNLIELIKGAAKAFKKCDREVLDALLESSSAALAECDGLENEVVETLWQACRGLQAALSDENELNAKTLEKIHSQFENVAGLLNKEEPADEETESTGTLKNAYVIPADDVPLIEDFISESIGHLEDAEAALLDLEADVENKDVLNLIFRAFHTIKGMAGFMNLEEIGQLTHNAENLLDLARNGDLIISGANADVVFKTIDMLKTMVESLTKAIETNLIFPPQGGVDELSADLKDCAEGRQVSVTPAPKDETETLGEETEPQPEPPADTEPAPSKEQPAAKKQPKEKKPAAANSRKGSAIEETIKVKTTRLDNLINMVGELVIAQLMVMESHKTMDNSEERYTRNITHQGKLIRELQELAMSMRMVPIAGIFQKMARMSRDLSRQAGKAIEFSMEGEQTELDRTIVDKLADPLVHMIRNSVDHGIETPEERLAAGKPDVGHIQLRAFHASGNIVIELEDDGKGLNRDKLLNKGIQQGIFKPDITPTDQEIFSVIFTPGLSTAEKVTKVSGRGVGMDVVKRNIEALRGRIDITSTPGEGTIFTVTLPLTLAIIDGQIIRVGSDKYIIPINVVRNSFRPIADDITSVQNRCDMVMDRGELLRLVRLHEQFDIEPEFTDPTQALVMVVEQDNQACGLLVDELLDQQQVVIKNLGSILKETPGIAGGAIMGNGQISLILDIPGIIKLSQN